MKLLYKNKIQKEDAKKQILTLYYNEDNKAKNLRNEAQILNIR